MTDLLLIIGITFMYSSPLIFGAMAGVISERSGVINLGIEGMMTIGAFTASAITFFCGNPWIGFLFGGLAGIILALVHAIASVSFNADQTISGIAINFIGPGLALFISRILFQGTTYTPPTNTLPNIFGTTISSDNKFSSLNFNVTVIMAFLVTAILWLFLYKTKWGLRIRAVGENPSAADTLGISVYKIRYSCVLLSGFLSGLGGASMTLAIVTNFTPAVISGQGFIALAAVIFGKWTPFGAYASCLLFGFAQALTIYWGGGKFAVSEELLSTLPYVLTILMLIFFVGRSVAPKADGLPYKKRS